MLFRKKSMQFVDEWIRIIESDEKIWDQNAFNDLVRKGQEILPDDPNHYFKGAQGVHQACAAACACVRQPPPEPAGRWCNPHALAQATTAS